jgi:hypothetical protein
MIPISGTSFAAAVGSPFWLGPTLKRISVKPFFCVGSSSEASVHMYNTSRICFKEEEINTESTNYE